MQMIFITLSGSSGQVPVTLLVELNVLRSMGIACIYRVSEANSSSLKRVPQLHVQCTAT